jgi:hypothetical protein
MYKGFVDLSGVIGLDIECYKDEVGVYHLSTIQLYDAEINGVNVYHKGKGDTYRCYHYSCRTGDVSLAGLEGFDLNSHLPLILL